MAKTLDVKTITRIVGDKVHEIFGTDAAFIFLLDAETNLIHCYYGFDKGEGGYVEDLVPFPVGTGLSSKVILSRQPLLLGSIEEQVANGAYYDEDNLEQSSGVKTQSWLGVPIIVSDKVLGVVHLSDYRPAAYNQDHLRLLQTLASNMGVAIANARQFEAEANAWLNCRSLIPSSRDWRPNLTSRPSLTWWEINCTKYCLRRTWPSPGTITRQ